MSLTVSQVYMAMNKATGEILAVKQLQFNDKEEDQIKQIEQEISLMRELDHPNIVRFYEVQRCARSAPPRASAAAAPCSHMARSDKERR
jgi:serine/threonine protein kinase